MLFAALLRPLENISYCIETNTPYQYHERSHPQSNKSKSQRLQCCGRCWCYHWIVNSFTPDFCRQPSGSSQLVTNCNCDRFLLLESNTRKARQVAEYAKMKRETKRELLYEWTKVAASIKSVSPGKKLSLMVPSLPTAGVEDNPNPLICRNALIGVLNEGRKSWKSVMLGPSYGQEDRKRWDWVE